MENLIADNVPGDLIETGVWRGGCTMAPGGFVIVDDYVIPACREAVHCYRDDHGIDDLIERIDGTAVFWRRAEA